MQENERSYIRLTTGQLAGIVVVTVVIAAMLTFGFANAYLAPEEEQEPEEGDLITQAENYPELVRAIQLIRDNYVDRDAADVEKMIEGAIEGAIGSTGDRYSTYFDASALEDFQQETVEGEYSGIGASIQDIDGYVTIMVPFEESPAATTSFEGAEDDDPVGLRPGDRILTVDGVDVVGMSADHVAEMIRGPVGEKVEVKVERPDENGAAELIFNFERAEVEIPTVESEVIDGDVGLLSLTRFTGQTPQQVSEQLAYLEDQDVSGVIIDLRNNPGGTLEECVAVADMFLPEGVVLQVVGRDGETEEIRVSGDAYPKPLVVLVNEFTASGGEILAGALNEQMDVPLVGTTTFGKGSVQRLFYLDEDRPTGMKLTTERFLTPSGYSIEEEGGLKVDHEVPGPEDGRYGDLDADPQLQKALELMRERLNR